MVKRKAVRREKRPVRRPRGNQAVKSKSVALPKRGRRPMRLVEFPIPHGVSEDDFNEICYSWKIPAERREELRRRVNQVVDFLARWMGRLEEQPPRSVDTQNLKRARAPISKALFVLRHGFGPVGTDGLRAAAEILATALDRQWLLCEFKDRNEAALLELPDHSPDHPPLHVSNDTVRRDFCRTLPGEVLVSVLTVLENSLTAALDIMKFLPGAHGGRERLEARHFLVLNLMEIYWETFQAVPTTGESRFAKFASAVFETIGWGGAAEKMENAIPSALIAWKNLHKRNHGISDSLPSG